MPDREPGAKKMSTDALEELAHWLEGGIAYLNGLSSLPARDSEQRIIAYQNALRVLREIQQAHREPSDA